MTISFRHNTVGTFKTKVLGGLKWSTGGRGAQIVIQIVQYAILARLLTPEEFGLFSMTNIVLGFSMQLGDAGLSTAIIQSKDLNKEKFSTLYFLSILIGIVIFAGINLTKGFVELFFNADGLSGLLFMGSFIFLIIPIGKQYQTLFQKELMFETIVKVELTGKLFSALTCIILAFYGLGVKSLIWGLILDHTIRYTYFFFRGTKRHYRLVAVFRLQQVKREVKFGLNSLGASFTNYIGSRMDKILIGRFLGEGALGFYEIAFNLVIQPLYNLSPILNRVVLPSFAKIQDDVQKIKKYYFNSIEYLNLFIVPLMIGISLTAKPIVLILYGSQWQSSVVLVQILAFVALFEIVGDPYRSVLYTLGKARKIFFWEIYVTAVKVLVILIAVQHNVIYVAYGLLFTQIFNFVVKYFWLVKPEFEHIANDYFIRNFLLQFVYCLPMLVILVMANSFLNIEIYYRLLINGISGFTIFLLTLLLFERTKIISVKSHIRFS